MADNGNLWPILLIPVVGYGLYQIFKGRVPTGNVTLTVTASTGGITNPAVGAHNYAADEQVFVYAFPNVGYRFSHWSGDIGTSDPQETPIGVLMTGNKQITANFELVTLPVTVHITIQSSLGGHTVPPVGTYEFNEGAIINAPAGLLAVPDEGYEFQEWVGYLNCPAGGLQNPIICVVRAADEGQTITAVFSQGGVPGIQLDVGWNEELTYGGSGPLAIQIAMSGIWSFVLRVWCFQNGVWKMYDPSDIENSDLVTLYTGDTLGILMSMAYFWVWV